MIEMTLDQVRDQIEAMQEESNWNPAQRRWFHEMASSLKAHIVNEAQKIEDLRDVIESMEDVGHPACNFHAKHLREIIGYAHDHAIRP